MNWLDVAVIVLTIGYSAYVVFGKRKRSCCGNCSSCQGCAYKKQ